MKATTLHRYFQSWKRRKQDELDRLTFKLARMDPEMATGLAGMTGLSLEQVVEAVHARNPRAALHRASKQEIERAIEQAEQGREVDTTRLRLTFRSYWGVDRELLLNRMGRAFRQGDIAKGLG